MTSIEATYFGIVAMLLALVYLYIAALAILPVGLSLPALIRAYRIAGFHRQLSCHARRLTAAADALAVRVTRAVGLA